MKMEPLFDEVKNYSRSRQIVDKFRKAIAEGSLKVGDKLPPERELCVQLGVSRTALREAIRTLAAYGVLEPLQGGGTFVTDKFTENVFEFLGFGDKLDYGTMRQLLNVRSIIETGAIETVAETATDAELEKLGGLVARLEAEKDDEKVGELDALFHETIIELSHNPILTALYRMIWKMLSHGTSQVIAYPTARAIAVKDHKAIYQALRARDKALSKRRLVAHFAHTQELLETHYAE